MMIGAKMLRHVLLLLAGLGLATLSAPARAQDPAPRPNILYIVADDLGWADTGFQGSDIQTPALDALAAEGARFMQFYAQPMCTQTRAALMTGRYPMRTGLQSFVILPEQTYGIPLEEKLLPQILKEAGYDTALIGKWHLGHADPAYWPRQRGFDYHYGTLIGEIDYFTRQIHGLTDWYRDNEVIEEEGYVTELLGQDAVRYIEEHDGEDPFFLYLAFTAPHTPFQAPEADLARYDHVADPNRRAYAAMVTAMDTQIAAVIDALERSGQRDDTLVIFHSDNGGVRTAALAGEIEFEGDLPASNGDLRGGKGDLFEGGTRVVAFAHWPGVIAEGTVDGVMHVVDMLPTLAGVAGAEVTGTQPLDGLDVWQTIATGAPSPRSEIVYNVEMFRGALRDGDWKLFYRAPLPSARMLFNLADDPNETTDRAADHPEIAAALEARIQELAGQMARSKFFEQTMQSYMGREIGAPAFPNTDDYFNIHD
ncbi:arylsulfatase [Cribrihabitans sp. XS_ASV171]